MFKRKILARVFVLAGLILGTITQAAVAQQINMVFTSDVHYGITRTRFRGDTNVSSKTVNAAMVNAINKLYKEVLPLDSGVGAGKKIGAIDKVIVTGDIANRMEIPIQSAAISWQQFEADYMERLKVYDHNHKPAELLLAPGNHDISNAIGHYKPMMPLTDPSAMVAIYNKMMKPKVLLTNATYNYKVGKVNYTREIGGVHFMFITLWPDSAERIWMEKDLEKVSKSTPVIIFTHDQPECEAKHFTNPSFPHDINKTVKFENLTAEMYKDSNTAAGKKETTAIEQRGWVAFLKKHPNIKAYFHGNSNFNQFYIYHGPDNDVDLNIFRVDSPMKGDVSSIDETKLSFQLISLDPKSMKLTVRECLWNTHPENKDQPIIFGISKTIDLK